MSSLNTMTTYMTKDLLAFCLYVLGKDFRLDCVTGMFVVVPDDTGSNWSMSLVSGEG